MSFSGSPSYPSVAHFPSSATYIRSLTNAQKLSLPVDTLVGTEVMVNDWFSAGLSSPHQILTAPSTAQGGVFASGGTQDGIYTDRGAINSKKWFEIIGGTAIDPADGQFAAVWDSVAARWLLYDDNGNPVYYSSSDVATPDLASNWKNTSDDSAASITVTSVTAGQITAGLKVGSTFYSVTTSTNGRNGYHDVLGVAADYTFDGTKWTNGTTNGGGNTACPWDGGIGTRDDVCSETNWSVVS